MSANKIMVLTLAAIVAIMMLTGCAGKPELTAPVRTVEVNTPILELRPAPDDLKLQPVADADMPAWVAPTYPGASSCLTIEGEAKKRMLDTGTIGRLRAWEQWGILP